MGQFSLSIGTFALSLWLMKAWVCLFFALSPMAIGQQQPVADENLPLKRIAVVRDGDFPYFEGLIRGLDAQLKPLASGQYRYEFDHGFDAKGDSEKVSEMLAGALADETVDVVYAAGILASHQAAKLPQRAKPVLAGAIEFSNLNSSLINERGGSKLANYTFIISPRRVMADLEMIRRLIKDDKDPRIDLLLDDVVVEDLPVELKRKLDELGTTLGVRLELRQAGSSVESAIKAIPADASMVYFSLLPSFSSEQRHAILQGLAKRGIPSFSMLGRSDVEHGALVGLAADNRELQHRRSALNIHQLLSGLDTSSLPVVLNTQDRLTINLNTARALGWSPDYDTTLEAELLHRTSMQASAGAMSLAQAFEKAVKNPQLVAAHQRVREQQAARRELGSLLRPQLSVTGNAGYSGIHDRINPLSTSSTTFSGSLGLQLSQVLFSDRIGSAIKAQDRAAKAAKHDAESVRLDLILATARAYFSVLEAEELYEVERANLALIQSNLQLAKMRKDIGVAEAAEIFRWQAAAARGRATLIQRDSTRRDARVQLNVVTASPRSAHWQLEPWAIDSSRLHFMDEHMRHLVTDLNDLRQFVGFLPHMAVWRSPELASFKETLAAQGILLKERKRRNYMPEVQLSAGAQRTLLDLSGRDADGQNEWSVGIGFVMPLYEGGNRDAESERIHAVIRQLAANRENAGYLIEQSALSAGYAVSAGHPNLRLSELALEASQANYDAIRSKYTLGAVPLITLLDAQSDLLSQRQAAARARYQYLIDLHEMQRAMSWFEFSKTPEQKAQWAKHLRNYMQSGSLHVEVLNHEPR